MSIFTSCIIFLNFLFRLFLKNYPSIRKPVWKKIHLSLHTKTYQNSPSNFRWEEKLPMSKSPLESTWLYHEIGRCYLELQRYQDARDFGEKAIQAAKEAEDDGWQLHASVLVAQSEGKRNMKILTLQKYTQREGVYLAIVLFFKGFIQKGRKNVY